MERPKSILGLTVHAARLRWQALTPRARMVAIAVGTFMTLAVGSLGAHAAMGCSAHCGGCPSMAAHGCPHSHH